MTKSKLDVSAAFFRKIADAAAAETLPRFRREGAVSNKLKSGFDPVTEADREAEKAIRAVINSEYPDHGILGEEFGAENSSSPHIWVIDPIDGTRVLHLRPAAMGHAGRADGRRRCGRRHDGAALHQRAVLR